MSVRPTAVQLRGHRPGRAVRHLRPHAGSQEAAGDERADGEDRRRPPERRRVALDGGLLYGDVDGRVVAAARAAGYTAGAALPAVWHAPRPLETPRVGVYAVDDGARLRVKTSRAVRALRARLGR